MLGCPRVCHHGNRGHAGGEAIGVHHGLVGAGVHHVTGRHVRGRSHGVEGHSSSNLLDRELRSRGGIGIRLATQGHVDVLGSEGVWGKAPQRNGGSRATFG